jgi:hypothetical protein
VREPADGGDEHRLGNPVAGLHPLDAVEVGAQAAHHAGDRDVQHPVVERYGESAEHHAKGRPPVGRPSLLRHGNGFLRVQLFVFTADMLESVKPSIGRRYRSLNQSTQDWYSRLHRKTGLHWVSATRVCQCRVVRFKTAWSIALSLLPGVNNSWLS